MNRTLILALLLAATSRVAAQVPARVPTLAERLDRRLDAPGLDRLLWGVAVTDLDGHLLYGRNADRLFIPASNTKLVVTAVASALLGPDFKVATSVYGTGPITDGVLRGDLVLYGRGDPTFSNRCYAADTTKPGVCDRDPAAKLRELARQLAARGVKTIDGDLIGDGSYFEPRLVHPAWENFDLGWWYAAPVSGLGFNDNSIDLFESAGDVVGARPVVTAGPDIGAMTFVNEAVVGPRGSAKTFDVVRSADGLRFTAIGSYPTGSPPNSEYAAVADPNRYAALALRRALVAAGITVRGQVRSTVDSMEFRAARSRPLLAEVQSRPFRDWLFPILSRSQNWFAEMTLKQLGKRFGAAGSWDEGIRIERRFLIDSIGVDSTQFAVFDGAGLAMKNLVSPRAFTRMLTWLRKLPSYPMIDAALPQGGRSGSLRQRFVGSPLEGRVHAKTGAVGEVNALSGYVEREDGKVLVFSVMANHHLLSGSRMNAVIDSIVMELGRP